MKCVIVGGGIAGLGTALNLLHKRQEVEVYEKLKGPIDRVCGEGLLPFGVAAIKKMGLLTQLLTHGHRFYGIEYHLGTRTVGSDFGDGDFGIGIERGHLDRILREACARFPHFTHKQGTRISPDEILRCKTREGFRLIAADGVQSPVAKALGARPLPSGRIGVRFRLETAPPKRVHVYFQKYGEIYVTPTGPRGLSVAMLLSKLPVRGKHTREWCLARFREVLPEYAAMPVFGFQTRAPIAVGWRETAASRGVIRVGDAQRAFDPITGAGMSFALTCAEKAAEHLDDPKAYWRETAKARHSVGGFTNLVLGFTGANWRTRLVLRQLALAPSAFSRILDLHDGAHHWLNLEWRHMRSLLRLA